MLVALGFALALFFAHLFALAVYGMSVLAFELGWIYEHRPRWTAVAREAVICLLPFFVPPLLIVRSCSIQIWRRHGTPAGC
jgi:hypothetical protein